MFILNTIRTGVRTLRVCAAVLLCLGLTDSYAGIPYMAENSGISMADSLPEITVTADVRREAIKGQTMDAEQIGRLNSHSVADAIRYFSGVQVKDYGGVGGVKTIDIRSMGTNHMGVFYDGIQLGNAQNGQIDLGKYSLDNIEAITLYNGQKSDIMQPARDFGSAGSVYIRTRRPLFTPGRKLNVNVTLRTGSFGLANPSARFEYRLSKRVALTANAEYTYANGRYKFRYRKLFSDGTVAYDTTATRRNGDIHALRLEGGAFGNSDGGQWQAKVYYYDSSRGIPGAIVNNVWKNSQRQWDRNLFVQGYWQQRTCSRHELLVSAKYAHDRMRYLNPDTTLMYVDNSFTQQEAYLSAANRIIVTDRLQASVAADWQWNSLGSDMREFHRPVRNTLLCSAALAWAAWGLKAQASTLLTYVNDHTSHHTATLTRLTPALFVSYQPEWTRGVDIHGFVKRIFRMPTFNDLYYTEIGNAKLRPEYATQYDLGATYTILPAEGVIDALELSAEGYRNIITDKIIAVPKGTGQYRWMMMNIGRVHTWGAEFTARGSALLPADVRLNLRLAYTWQRALDYSDPSDTGSGGTYRGQIAYIPNHSGSATGGAEWHSFSANYSFIYIGRRWHTSANIPENLEQPWYTHDLSAGYTFTANRLRYSLNLEVNNLFNQQYEVIRNYPMPGRNFKVTLRMDI